MKKRLLSMVLCGIVIFGTLPSVVFAEDHNGTKEPQSFNASGTEQPVRDEGYSTPIDYALQQQLEDSKKDVIAVKNAFFDTEGNRANGIIKTDIAMLGNIPANGIDVMFVSDVSGSMSLYARAKNNAPYACSCWTTDHVYYIPKNFEFTTINNKTYTLDTKGEDKYFSLSELEEELGTPLRGIQWTNMNWEKIFQKLEIPWPEGMTGNEFLIGWQPDMHHCKSNHHVEIPKEAAPAIDPNAKPTPAYYSPSTAWQETYGCSDRMTIARDNLKGISERILNYSKNSHIGLVDFAGNHTKNREFTSDITRVNEFLSDTTGYDYTHYHLGINKAAEMIEEHYVDNSSECKNPLYVVFISDGVPDYGGYGAGQTDPTQAINQSIAKLHSVLKKVLDDSLVLGDGKGVELYAAGICVSPTATGPQPNPMNYPSTIPKNAEAWLRQIATLNGANGIYKNCGSISEFQDFTQGILVEAADALKGTLADKLGDQFSFYCDETHPISLTNYEGERVIYHSIEEANNAKPKYISIDEEKKTLTWNISSMRTYSSDNVLGGLRIDFYSKLSEQAMQSSGEARESTYPTNDGDATLTYTDRNNNTQVIVMPPPFVKIVETVTDNNTTEPVDTAPDTTSDTPVKKTKKKSQKTPDTGDVANATIWFLLTSCAMFGLCATTVYIKKNKE